MFRLQFTVTEWIIKDAVADRAFVGNQVRRIQLQLQTEVFLHYFGNH